MCGVQSRRKCHNHRKCRWYTAGIECRYRPADRRDHYGIKRGIVSVAFSRSGERAVTTSKDKSAKLWDALTGQAIGEPLRFPGQGLCAVFSPDGTTMFTLCERPGPAAPGFNQSTGRGTPKT